MNSSSAHTTTVDNFKIIKTINKGAFAQVYEALDMSTGTSLALKIVSLLSSV